MKAKSRKRLGDLLLESGVITESQLTYALANKAGMKNSGIFS